MAKTKHVDPLADHLRTGVRFSPPPPIQKATHYLGGLFYWWRWGRWEHPIFNRVCLL